MNKYFEIVPITEKPEKDGWYYVMNPNREILPRMIEYKVGSFHNYNKVKDYSHIHFARGGHFHPSLPQMTIESKGIKIGTGKPEWGAEPGKEYFVIKLGDIISKSNKQ